IPQIEVSFDIDANGIVNVSAKDMGTGKEQKITLTASTKMSDADIEKKVKEAEQFAEEDQKKKEAIEIKNNADSLVYQTEKTLKDLEGKISDEEKAAAQTAADELKKAIESNDTALMKEKTEALTKVFNDLAQKLYAQAGPEGGPEVDPNSNQGAPNDDVVDADFEEIHDDNENN
ncbi:MAG: Hsp70 family protein, partial [Tissierellia bacterium]|nr:Hsp70 family protein [Tissierellia bacterium]